MKNQFLKNFCATALISTLGILSVAHAQGPATAVPGYMPEFDYQVTNFGSLAEAQAAMNTETKETSGNSICANRAAIWSFMMNKTMNINVGKMFMFFTDKSDTTEDSGEWAFHVAPYVLINGEEYVLDMGFGVFNGAPVPLEQWEEHFSNGGNCAVLDPVNNPADLALEKNNMGGDQYTPFTNGNRSARQYPSKPGVGCYVRKMPMFYGFPVAVYGADLALTGHTDYKSYLQSSFDPEDTIASCRQATTFGFKLSHSCAKYLGLEKKD